MNGSFPALLLRCRASVGCRVIAGAGCDVQTSGSSERLDLNRVVGTGRVRVRRAVPDYVLTPNVLRNRTRDRLNLVETRWKERSASSLLGESAQGLPVTLISPVILFESDGIKDRSVLRLQLVEKFLESGLACVVPSVGHN